MPKHAAPLECSDEVRAELTAMSRSRAQEARMVERARIVLACLEGKEIQQVAKDLDSSSPTVSKWRKRFGQQGLIGLRDQSRSGKPPVYDAAFRHRVLALLEQPPPAGLSQWDGPTVAETLNASVHAVWRVLRKEGIYLQRGEQIQRAVAFVGAFHRSHHRAAVGFHVTGGPLDRLDARLLVHAQHQCVQRRIQV